MTPAETLRTARIASGLTQEKLGIAVGLEPKWAQSLVAGWENGKDVIPRGRLKEVAKLLKIPIDELI